MGSGLALALFVIFSFGLVSANDFPVLKISQGVLRGTTLTSREGKEIFGFLGIPYAAAPVGSLRFKSPAPPPSWEGERDASKEGNACLQKFVLIEKLRNSIIGNEDCLYLNVYTPKRSEDDRLPVMVFIHGGGFVGGSGSLSEYGPQLLLDRDVILVTINYRLGPLGFLSTGDSVLPGNLGLKDQRTALRWVQDNIRHFNGDERSVTIFGESAGGASVHLHLLSPSSRGLFHTGISQSGSALCPWAFSDRARHRQLTAKLASLVQCPNQPSDQLRECLMKLPAERIVGELHNFIVWDMEPVVLFNPAIEPEDVDDAFLTEDPWSLTSNVPWMLGFNSDEGSIKLASLTQGDVVNKMKMLNENFGSLLPISLLYQLTAKDPDQVTASVRKFYFGEVEKITLEMSPEMVKMYTDAWFTQGIMDSMRRHSGPVFLYYFAYNTNHSMCNHYFDNPQHMGVCHFDDLKYLFPLDGHSPKLMKNNPDYLMSKKMVQLWTNYAKERIPMLDDNKLLWISNNGSKSDYLMISNEEFSIKKGLLPERVNFWKNLPIREKSSVTHNVNKQTDEL